MISADITSGQSECKLPETPLIKSVSVNVSGLALIYNYLRVVEGKEWLDHATKEAMTEMISDFDDVVREAEAVIRVARKQIPLRYKVLFFFKSWLQKLK